MPLLSVRERDTLAADLPQWTLAEDGKSITRDAKFDGFTAAWSFMTRVAAIAEKLDHHPDWSNAFNKVHMTLSTHDEGGLTSKDAEMARAIEALLSAT